MSVFTGYRFDLEDKDFIRQNSTPYSLLMQGPEEWQELDLAWWHIRNQGPVGSCRGHSLAANRRLCYFLEKAGVFDLDGDGVKNEDLQDDFAPMWCYLVTQRHDGIRGDSGSTISGGIKTGMENGVCREVVFPYPGRYTTSIPSEAAADAAKYKFARYTEFGPGDAAKAADWVGSGQGGLDLGQMWPLRFEKGCLVRTGRGGGGGGHATAGIGLVRGDTLMRRSPDLRGLLKEDEWVFDFANSHGEHAQFNGHYYVTLKAMDELLEQRYTSMIGWSDSKDQRVRRHNFREKSVYRNS
jgi:hypothetical protein